MTNESEFEKKTLEQLRTWTSTLFSLTATSPASRPPFLCPPCPLSPPSLETWDGGAFPLFRLPPHAATTKPAHILKVRGGLRWAATTKWGQTMVYHHLVSRCVFFLYFFAFFITNFHLFRSFSYKHPPPTPEPSPHPYLARNASRRGVSSSYHHSTPPSFETRVGNDDERQGTGSRDVVWVSSKFFYFFVLYSF